SGTVPYSVPKVGCNASGESWAPLASSIGGGEHEVEPTLSQPRSSDQRSKLSASVKTVIALPRTASIARAHAKATYPISPPFHRCGRGLRIKPGERRGRRASR